MPPAGTYLHPSQIAAQNASHFQFHILICNVQNLVYRQLRMKNEVQNHAIFND